MEKYKEFFDFIKDILEKQQAQKSRGMNDYNMVNVVRNEYSEEGMHSNVIYSLLDYNGLHYQDDLFLNLFVEKVLGIKLKDFGKILEIQVEEETEEKRRVDFTIKSENYFVGIEMKVNAGDSDNQIFDYYNYLEDKANKKEVIIYYLTKYGNDASEDSKKDVKIKKISFKDDILNWIDACQNEVKNITNLNVALENYKNIVEKITNKYKGNVVRLADKLKKNKKQYEIALSLNEESLDKLKEYKMASYVKDELVIMRKESINHFFQKIKANLEKILGDKWEVELDNNLNKSRRTPLKIFKTQWNKNRETLIFGFEFFSKDYSEGTFGLFIYGVKQRKGENIRKIIYEKFKPELEKIELILKRELELDKHWLDWVYLPSIEKHNDDIVKYINFTKKAEEKFVKEILNVIQIFEKDNLITDINSYLNENID